MTLLSRILPVLAFCALASSNALAQPQPYRILVGFPAGGTTALGDFLEPHAAGKLRVIGVLGTRRSPALPDVPTFAEQGEFFPAPGTPEALAQLVKSGTDFWEPVVRASGWVPQ